MILSVNSCASDNTAVKDINLSNITNEKKMILKLNKEEKVELEFLNMEFSIVDKPCLIEKISIFRNIIKRNKYGIFKHKSMWKGLDFSNSKKIKMIYLKLKEYEVVLIIDDRYREGFEILSKPLDQIKYGDKTKEGYFLEKINFVSCFK